MRLRDPQRPSLAELLAMDQDDRAFLFQLYALLLGREPDPIGLHAYQSQLPRVGRLFTLTAMLCSGEARQHLAVSELQLPPGARWASRLRPLFGGGWARKLLRPLALSCRLWEWSCRNQLELKARCLRAEADLDWQQGRFRKLLGDIDHSLAEHEQQLLEQRRSTIQVQNLRVRLQRLVQHGLEAEAEAGIFEPRGEQQQRLLEALAARWEGRL